MKIPYQYEPQSFQVEPNLFYLPDFWLPSQEMYVEIKPDAPTEDEARKVVGLQRITGKKVLVFAGFPEIMPFTNYAGTDYNLEICNYGIFAVNGNSCERYAIGTLSETMLYVLGLLARNTNDNELRTNTLLLVDAVKRSNDYFANPVLFMSMRDLIQKLLRGNAGE